MARKLKVSWRSTLQYQFFESSIDACLPHGSQAFFCPGFSSRARAAADAPLWCCPHKCSAQNVRRCCTLQPVVCTVLRSAGWYRLQARSGTTHALVRVRTFFLYLSSLRASHSPPMEVRPMLPTTLRCSSWAFFCLCGAYCARLVVCRIWPDTHPIGHPA